MFLNKVILVMIYHIYGRAIVLQKELDQDSHLRFEEIRLAKMASGDITLIFKILRS